MWRRNQKNTNPTVDPQTVAAVQAALDATPKRWEETYECGAAWTAGTAAVRAAAEERLGRALSDEELRSALHAADCAYRGDWLIIPSGPIPQGVGLASFPPEDAR